jgi:APA family basic amino acid/polyamine antiporter
MKEHDASPARTGASLLRVLGVGFGLAVIIGNTIGTGILRTPGGIATRLPGEFWFVGVWVLGGLYALLGAFAVSELSTMIPRSGGYYVFARRALGEFAGFAIGWTDWLAQCGTTAAVAIVIGEYMGDLVPALDGRAREMSTAVAVTVGMALVQWRGIRWASTVQNLTSALKAFGFLALVAVIFALARPVPSAEAAPSPAAFSLVAFILALQAVIYTYDGWYGVIYFGEELRDPARDAPRSTIGGVFSLMAIYVLVNLALVYALPLSRIAGQNLAIGTAAESIFGRYADTLIRVLTIVSMLSGINAYHLMASRIPFAMGKDRLLPEAATRVNAGGTPTVSLFTSMLAAVVFILMASVQVGEATAFDRALAITAFFFVVNYLVAYLSVFVLRRREPDAPRPYRALGYPWTTGLALAGSLAFLVGAVLTDTANSVWAAGVLVLSYPLFLATTRGGRPFSDTPRG